MMVQSRGLVVLMLSHQYSGRYDWVFDLDLTSMYPSIIMSLNMSPETKIGKINGWDGRIY